MNHRIFIAVNLPDEVRKQLSGYQDKWPDLPISWTKKYNLHITLAFLGYVSDEDIMDVCKTVERVSSKNKAFSVNLNRISYGPPKKIPPRMVWAEGEESESLGKIQKELEDALFKNSIKGLKLEKRKFTPHITLGRMKTWQWQKLEPEERPEVNEEMNLEFDIDSIEVMESFLKRGGPEYTILESYPLKS
jgi:2'-5' RNA ligase